MSDIKKFLSELVLNTPTKDDPIEFGRKLNTNPTSQDKNDARLIVQKLRGVPVGRKIDLNEERPTNITNSDPKALSLIVKNDSEELVFVTETQDGNLIISSISKRRYIQRDTIILQRGLQFLRRFLVQV